MARERHDLTEMKHGDDENTCLTRIMSVKLQVLLCYSRLPCSASTETSAGATSVTYLTSTASSSPPAAIHTHCCDVSPACAASSVDNDRYMQHRKQLWAASGKTLPLQVRPHWCIGALWPINASLTLITSSHTALLRMS